MATLVITRAAQRWIDRARVYRILVDDEDVGSVARGQRVALDVAPGPHRVRLAIDWCGSPELEVEASDAPVDLACGANANPFTAIFYVLSRPQRYLWLERREAGSEAAAG